MQRCRRRAFLAAILVSLAAATDHAATLAVAQPYAPSAVPSRAAPPVAVPPTTVPSTAVEPGYLGVLADESGQTTGGIRLLDVVAGGPAQAAGLRAGDVITSIDGQTANNVDDMANLMGGRPAGDQVTFVVRRGNDVSRVEVRLSKRPSPEQRRYGTFGRVNPNSAVPPSNTAGIQPPPSSVAPSIRHPGAPTEPLPVPGVPPNTYNATSPLAGVPQSKALLGVRAVPIVPEIQRSLNLPEARGALIVEVQPGSPAQKAGLPLEAVVVGIDGLPINSPQELAEAISERGAGTDVRLSYFRFGQLTEKFIRLGVGPSPAGANGPPSSAPMVLAPPPNSLPPSNVPPSVLTPPPSIAPLNPSPSNTPSSNTLRPSTNPTITPVPTTPPAVLPPATKAAPPTNSKPPVSTPPVETEADKLRRQIREMEAKLSELEKQKPTKPAELKPPAKTP